MNRELARYSPRVLELFAHLPGAEPLPPGPGIPVAGEAIVVERGAWVRFDARVESARILQCVFRAWGCPHTLAAAAWVASEVRARRIEDCASIDASRLARELDAPAEKMGRILVVEDALRALLERARAVQ
jgi:NifU-like protein involved in Fe-S cluster formation